MSGRGDLLLAAGGMGVVGVGGLLLLGRLRSQAAGVVPATVAPSTATQPGPSGPPAAAPMTLATLLAYPVGHIPVPDAVAWIPAQTAARVMQAQGAGYGLFDLSHHPVGYTFPDGQQHIAAQRAAAYLWDLGVDPCPPALYADLLAASQATGVPMPLLLGVAHTESTFLLDGTAANRAVISAAGDVGLMQVGPSAAAQVGLPWASVQASAATNALAGAKYLAYLATQAGIAPTSTDYPAWAPVLARYGEPNSPAIALAQDAGWVAQHTPAQAAVTQQATNHTAAPVAYLRPAAVVCQTAVAHLAVGGATKTVTSRVCSNGTRSVVSIT